MDDKNSGNGVLNRLYNCVNVSAQWLTEGKKQICTPRFGRRKLCPDGSCDKPDSGLGADGGAGGGGESDVEGEAEFSQHESQDGCPPSPCPEPPPTILPSKACPPRQEQCCFIKMQDPCAPCCCEPKVTLPPCPPKCYPEKPRESICGCDYCKKPYADGKCCKQKPPFSSSRCDPRQFQQA